MVAVTAVFLAVAVSGCDPEEQGRPLSFSGAYGGPQAPALSPETRQALAERAEHQRGVRPTLAAAPQQVGPRPAVPPVRSVSGGSPWGAGASVRIGDGS